MFKVLYNKDMVMPYLEKLAQEIDDAYEKETIDTLYIGGGTPSCLSENELKKLMEIISIFDLNNDYILAA